MSVRTAHPHCREQRLHKDPFIERNGYLSMLGMVIALY